MASLITDIGNAKLLVASPLNPVKIKSVVVGTGSAPFDSSIMSLQQQVWIGNASDPQKTLNNGLKFTTLIPSNVGSWTIQEWGLIDVEGDLIAYGQLDEGIYKQLGVMSIEPNFYIKLSSESETELVVTDSINFDHNALTNRNAVDSHPISSITGLDGELSIPRKYKKVTANYTVLNDDGGVIELDATGGSFIVSLPSTANLKGKSIAFVRTDSTANTVTIKPASGQKLTGEGRVVDDFPAWTRCNVYFQAADGFWILSRNYNTNVVTAPGDNNHYLVHDGNTVGKVVTDVDLIVLDYCPIAYPKSNPPSGYLIMMGQAISAATYPKLFALYGSSLPDLRAYTIRGLDYGRGIDVNRAVLSQQQDDIKSHSHVMPIGPAAVVDLNAGQGYGPNNLTNPRTSSEGGSETRVKNIAFLYIVKAG